MIQITFTPETTQQVAALAQAMMAYLGTTPVEAEAPKADPVAKKRKPAVIEPEAPAAAETPAPAPTVTLEQVRAKLTELSQGGKKDDIKVLIAKFGGTKLTDLKVEQYADVLAAAEAL